MATPQAPDGDKLDRATLRELIGTRSTYDSFTSALQAGVLLAGALGLGYGGFQIGYRRALQAELKDDPKLKLRTTGPVSGLSARELAARAFVKGSVIALAAASVMGVGMAYASAALRKKNEAADAQAEREAENHILAAWEEALRLSSNAGAVIPAQSKPASGTSQPADAT